MPRKKTAEDGETPTPAKASRKKPAAGAEVITLEPDEADLQDDELSKVAPVVPGSHLPAPVVPGALTNTALAAGEGDFDEDQLEDDEASGLEIQLGVLTAQIEELARVMATMAEKLDRIEAVVRSNANRASESRPQGRDERPRRDFQSRDDRPRSDASRERPAGRDFQPRGDRPNRDFGDRPQRSFQSRDDRPQRSFSRDDRPSTGTDRPRSFAPRGDSRGPSDRGDRPQRSFAPRGDSRGPSDRGGDRPRTDANRERPAQGSFSPRPTGDRGPARGNDSRGGFSKGFDRGNDSRGNDSRGNDSRGNSAARGFAPRPERTDRPKTESAPSEPRGFGRRKDHGFGGVEVKRPEED